MASSRSPSRRSLPTSTPPRGCRWSAWQACRARRCSRPVVGVDDHGTLGVDSRDLPAPEMSGRRLTGLGGLPSDAPALFELDHVILTNRALGERHAEDVADSAHSLSVGCVREVVVAVPPRVPGWIRDQLEDPRGGRAYLPGGGGHSVLGPCQSLASPSQEGWRSSATTWSAAVKRAHPRARVQVASSISRASRNSALPSAVRRRQAPA